MLLYFILISLNTLAPRETPAQHVYRARFVKGLVLAWVVSTCIFRLRLCDCLRARITTVVCVIHPPAGSGLLPPFPDGGVRD